MKTKIWLLVSSLAVLTIWVAMADYLNPDGPLRGMVFLFQVGEVLLSSRMV